MKLIDRLERRLGRFAIPNVTVFLIAGQTLFYVMLLTGKLDRSMISLAAADVLGGDWWRLITFVFDPPLSNPLFAFFAWYLFYLMGSALEEWWGAFRYNIYLLLGYLFTVGVSFLTPYSEASTVFLAGSVFLAFAFLYPDFQLLLFFILPVKVKWLAAITWLLYGYTALVGGWHARLLVLASVGNFLVFFARDIVVNIKYGKRRMERQMGSLPRRDAQPFHRCVVCGIDDVTHPQMDFRYCPECTGQQGYCTEHIRSHDHVQ